MNFDANIWVATAVFVALAFVPMGVGGQKMHATETHSITVDQSTYNIDGYWHHGQGKLLLTHNSEPASGVTIYVDGKRVGKTNSYGEVTFHPPDNNMTVMVVGDTRAMIVEMSWHGHYIKPESEGLSVSV